MYKELRRYDAAKQAQRVWTIISRKQQKSQEKKSQLNLQRGSEANQIEDSQHKTGSEPAGVAAGVWIELTMGQKDAKVKAATLIS